jgi:hypothetical protein
MRSDIGGRPRGLILPRRRVRAIGLPRVLRLMRVVRLIRLVAADGVLIAVIVMIRLRCRRIGCCGEDQKQKTQSFSFVAPRLCCCPLESANSIVHELRHALSEKTDLSPTPRRACEMALRCAAVLIGRKQMASVRIEDGAANRNQIHCAVSPPSSTNSAPVTKADSSESR